MLPTYQPQKIEPKWRHSKPSNSDNLDQNTFCLLLPPPNVTGKLHIGHALTVAIEDAIVRYQRMLGRKTLYLPGADHAGIATQVIVEKQLMKNDNLTKDQIGREKFIEKVWEWKNEYGSKITDQLKILGPLLDWDQEYFTMDRDRSLAVQEAFKILHQKGYIYRDTKLVNWDCSLESVISNAEVQYQSIEKPIKVSIPNYHTKLELGYIYKFKFPIADSDEFLEIYTTRPETMLGDTAVAIHPQDPRYQHLHGKYIDHPLKKTRIPIILDDQIVKMDFGSGAVKITPAHDPKDYQTGIRHHLEFIDILSDDGEINGIHRYQMRFNILREMKDIGLYLGKEPHKMEIGFGDRSGDIIEPRVKEQWFMKTDELANRILNLLDQGEITIIPSSQTSVFRNWLTNNQPWCISRQLWWGHPIPLEETDVLDTWFSSALLPFSALGWPKEEIKFGFPNALIETGSDIIFFWVIRMMMLSLAIHDVLPFRKILLHPIVRDRDGKKMSKSRGNVIDPVDIINGKKQIDLINDINNSIYLNSEEKKRCIKNIKKQFPNGIPECGTDSLRFSLLSYFNHDMSINLDIIRFYEYRTFCNKIWNAHKFLLLHCDKINLSNFFEFPPNLENGNVMNFWILSKLNQLMIEITIAIENYKFGQYTKLLYDFVMENFCSIYLETTKRYIADCQCTQEVFFYCLQILYRLLHLGMPFLTEELFHYLPLQDRLSTDYRIVEFPFPVGNSELMNTELENEFTIAFQKIIEIRNYKSSMKMNRKDRPIVDISLDQHLANRFRDQIIDLAFIEDFRI